MAAKKTKTTKSKPKKENPEDGARESFIPGAPEPKKPMDLDVETAGDPEGKPDSKEPISLKITNAEDRMLEIALTLPPLKTSIEKVFLPVRYSPEQLASIIASAIKRAAVALESDGIYQHAAREQEETEAKERYAARG
jgi:hypothetical protein